MHDIDNNDFDDFEIGIMNQNHSLENFSIRKNGRLMTNVKFDETFDHDRAPSRCKYIKNFEMKNNDIIDIQLNCETKQMEIWKNGEYFGIIFENDMSKSTSYYRLFVSAVKPGTKIEMLRYVRYPTKWKNDVGNKLQEISGSIQEYKEFVRNFLFFNRIMHMSKDEKTEIISTLTQKTIPFMYNDLEDIEEMLKEIEQ